MTGNICYDHYSMVWRHLKDGRPVSAVQILAVVVFGVFGLGFNYVGPSYDERIYEYWPILGISISFVLTLFCFLAILFGRREDWTVHHIRMSLCMMLFAFSIRQYEENNMDLKQREFAFVPFANKMFDSWLPGFHCKNTEDCVLSRYNAMAYGTAGIWPMLMAMPFFFTSSPLYAIFACGTVVVSSCGHLMSCVLMLDYSPGAFSSLVLVGPSAVYSTTLIANEYFASHPSVHVASVFAGAACHAVVAFMFFAVDIMNIFPQWLWPIAMWGTFSFEMGMICRMFGGPTEKFIAEKKREKESKKFKTLQEHIDDINNSTEHSSLL